MGHDLFSKRAIRVNWCADELPDDQGSRLARDVEALLEEDGRALSYGAVLEAARWAPANNPLVMADGRVVDWSIEEVGDAPYLRVELAVAPWVLETGLPPHWHGWSVDETGRVASPELPATQEETVFVTRMTVSRLFDTSSDMPLKDVRAMLDLAVTQLNALAEDALLRFAGPRDAV